MPVKPVVTPGIPRMGTGKQKGSYEVEHGADHHRFSVSFVVSNNRVQRNENGKDLNLFY